MLPSPAPRCHMSLEIDKHSVAPGLVKRRLLARRTCAKSHVPWGRMGRMPSPRMEDAVTGWYSTVFKRCAMHAIVQTRLCLERVRLSLCTDAPLNKSRMVVELR